MFCDIQRSTDLQHDVDAEEWRRILNHILGILTATVDRYEGTIDRFTGDGIVAIFGAPVGHEDHARRACAAALDIRRDVTRYARDLARARGSHIALRTGLHSGEVVVGGIGDELHMSYTAFGTTMSLAKRMEEVAEPGGICLSEDTAHLVDGFYTLDDVGPQSVKGFTRSVHTYGLVGPGPHRTPIDVARERGFSRFVGRADELAALQGALDRALAGDGQVVGVVGEAGVGKSRLCHEFVETCWARGISVRKTAAVAHERPIPHLPVIQLLRDFFDLAPQAPPHAVRDRVATRLEALGVDPEDIALLTDLLGAADPDVPPRPIDPEARQRRLLGVITRMTHARSQVEPAVLLVEDLHWLDRPSAAIIGHYIDTLPAHTLLLVNFRPEYDPPFAQRTSYTQIALSPLQEEGASELIDDLIGDDPSLVSVRGRIAERAQGNPFFIEQLVLALTEQGALVGDRGDYRLVHDLQEVSIPPTIHGTIASRIDRLHEPDKELLEVAAVIGREAPRTLIATVTGSSGLDTSLEALVRAELLRSGHEAEPTYEFRHPLTREVAYTSQLSERRCRTHAAVAQALQDLNPRTLDEHAPLIAHHYEGAEQPLDAAQWHRRSADRLGLRDVPEGQRHWERVRELLADLPESQETLELLARAHLGLLRLGYLQGTHGERRPAPLADALELAGCLHDRRLTAALLLTSGMWAFMTGDVPKAIELIGDAVRASEQADDEQLPLWMMAIHPMVMTYGGRLAEALRITDRVETLTADDFDRGRVWAGYRPVLFSRCAKSLALIEAGRLPEAEQLLKSTVQQSGAPTDEYPRSIAETYVGILGHARGDPEGGIAHAAAGVELAERSGSIATIAFSLVGLAAAHCARREWGEAERVLEDALDLMQTRGAFRGWMPLVFALLAEVHYALGDFDRAEEAAEEAVSTARSSGTPTAEVRGQLALARVLLRTNGESVRTEIEDCLARAVELTEQTGARLHLPFIQEQRGRLLEAFGDERGARDALEDAHRLYVEIGATGHAERLAREITQRACGPPKGR